ncbi:MAG: hypothetical protein H0Z31_00315 [Bacillus sp. (in: Bacteria)]|nr:hypothetical protein [Bacillus sp. (in: firmicutes)]
MSLLIFSKLFTRRRLQRVQQARQEPYLSVAREAGLRLAHGKRLPAAKCININSIV